MRRSDREIKNLKEVEEIIQKADVCRIAFANDNFPYIVTMNFGYSAEPSGSIYFHCAPNGKKRTKKLRLGNELQQRSWIRNHMCCQ